MLFSVHTQGDHASRKLHEGLHEHEPVHRPQEIGQDHQRQVQDPFTEEGEYQRLPGTSDALKDRDQHEFDINKRQRDTAESRKCRTVSDRFRIRNEEADNQRRSKLDQDKEGCREDQAQPDREGYRIILLSNVLNYKTRGF